MTKRIIGIAAALACYVAGSALVLDLAGATQQERLTIAEGETTRTAYDPIPTSEPGRRTVSEETGEPPVTPDECNLTPTSCDVIPVTVLPPANPGSEFLVRFSLFWEAQDTPGTDLASSNLDMYLWHDPPREQTVTYKDDDLASNDQPGASGRIPERIQMFTTEPGDFLLVVNNFLGSNDGHELELVYFSGELVTPFESLDPSFTPPEDRSAGPPPPPSSSPPPASQGSGGAGVAAQPPPQAAAPDAGTDTPQALALGEVGDTSAFSEISGLDESRFSGPPRTVPLRTTASSAPADVSGLALAAWFGGVPLAAAGAFGVLLVRKRRDVFAAAARTRSSGAPA